MKTKKTNPHQADAVVMCKCGKNPAAEPHICPFQSDIWNDDYFRCTCCADCEQECADDI